MKLRTMLKFVAELEQVGGWGEHQWVPLPHLVC